MRACRHASTTATKRSVTHNTGLTSLYWRFAAPQVGIGKSIAVYNIFGPLRLAATENILINPKVVSSSDYSWTSPEGCLSLPDARGPATRPWQIRVESLTLEGQPAMRTLEGVEARVVQHEIDHLNGVLFTESGWELGNLIGSSVCYSLLLVGALLVAKATEAENST